MKHTLIDDINRYLALLNDSGLYVTVHGRDIAGLLSYNIHRNPYCSYVKTDSDAWDTCIRKQRKLLRHASVDPLCGMCHAGMEEVVFFAGENAFVCVSGYGLNRERARARIRCLSGTYALSEAELCRLWEETLCHTPPDVEDLRARIRPLCYMLELLQNRTAVNEATDDPTFDTLLAYVQRNFMNDLCVREVADACACSPSTVTHLFRQRTGRSFTEVLTDLRIGQAKRLLRHGNLPVSAVASACGFANVNYFPTLFRRRTGMTPTAYRNAP